MVKKSTRNGTRSVTKFHLHKLEIQARQGIDTFCTALKSLMMLRKARYCGVRIKGPTYIQASKEERRHHGPIIIVAMN